MPFPRRFILTSIASSVFLTAGWQSSAACGCVVAGDEISLDWVADVQVRPPAEEPFGLRGVYAQHLEATIPTKPRARTPIHVRGVISFQATTAPLWSYVSRVVETAQGMVKLYPGAQIADLRAKGKRVVGSVVMEADSGAPGEPGETAATVQVLCSALVLGGDFDDFEGSPLGDGTWWQTRGSPARIWLRSRPDPNADAVVVAVHPSDSRPLTFARLEVRGSWMRIARAGYHAVVTGWAPTEELKQTPRAPGSQGGGYRQGPGLWGHGRPAKPPFYEGPARIAIGTTIYAEHGRGPWARVESDEEIFKIRYDEGDAWAEVIEIPGILGPDMRAYVPVSATKQAH